MKEGTLSATPLTQIRVSAPGKLMLLGEHAVVHHRPCLVTAMDARLYLKLELTEPGDDTFTVYAPDVGVDGSQGRLDGVPGRARARAGHAIYRARWPFSASIMSSPTG